MCGRVRRMEIINFVFAFVESFGDASQALLISLFDSADYFGRFDVSCHRNVSDDDTHFDSRRYVPLSRYLSGRLPHGIFRIHRFLPHACDGSAGNKYEAPNECNKIYLFSFLSTK